MVVKEPMKGYKAFKHDLTCKDFQYEIGKTYEIEGDIVPCRRGFHFCKSIADCYKYYGMHDGTRICEVEALDFIATDDNIKYVTNKIKIVAEVTEEWMRKGNVAVTSTGYCNTGDWNTGNHNTGDENRGNLNSGDNNAGSGNSGDWNCNNWNSGDRNSGICNSGDRNDGDRNSGDNNVGSHNTGYHNSGIRNSGNANSGSRNSGDYNAGGYNTGDWNCGNNSTGCFCTTDEPTIRFFDKDSNWTFSDWRFSEAHRIMSYCPHTYSDFIFTRDMTEKEKEDHPEYETIDGFIKVIKVTDEIRQKWWDKLSERNKNIVKSLPNFDPEKFKLCTGIDVTIKKED